MKLIATPHGHRSTRPPSDDVAQVIHAEFSSDSLPISLTNIIPSDELSESQKFLVLDQIIISVSALLIDFAVTSYWMIKIGMQAFSAVAIPLWIGILTVLSALNS